MFCWFGVNQCANNGIQLPYLPPLRGRDLNALAVVDSLLISILLCGQASMQLMPAVERL